MNIIQSFFGSLIIYFEMSNKLFREWCLLFILMASSYILNSGYELGVSSASYFPFCRRVKISCIGFFEIVADGGAYPSFIEPNAGESFPFLSPSIDILLSLPNAFSLIYVRSP